MVVFLLLTVNSGLQAQSSAVSGKVTDDAGKDLGMSSVALLHPSDSTVAYFGMSDETGFFRLRQVNPGTYLLNVNQFGYETYMHILEVPVGELNAGLIILKPLAKELDGVDVVGERSPMVLKKDTIEYNAAAFRTKPDAVVEELLQKLPGVEVDAAGNIKAQGNSVEKIMVDGKEFFSNDPKVVSQNLPADAVQKVQVFDEKSDEEEMTGTKDADQHTTINLVLKDDRKHLWFGSFTAGGGTESRFESGIKAFNFTPERQLAILGMVNNVNRFGFTMDDYIDYNGGIQRFMDEDGRITINTGELPIDFGQPVYGNNTSGVGALNYTRSKKKGKSNNLTYMGTGAVKRLSEESETFSYLPNGSITTNRFSEERQQNGSHRIGFNLKDKSDSSFQFRLTSGLSLGTGKSFSSSDAKDTLDNNLLNAYETSNHSRYTELKGNLTASYSRKLRKNPFSDIFRTAVNTSANNRITSTDWMNNSHFYTTGTAETEEQLLIGTQLTTTTDWSVAVIKRLKGNWFLEPQVKVAFGNEIDDRRQQRWSGTYQPVDSLSGIFSTLSYALTPEVSLRKSCKKLTLNMSLGYENGRQHTELKSVQERTEQRFGYLLPQLSVDYAFKQTNRIGLSVLSGTRLPQSAQLNPIVSTISRMQWSEGNPQLRPEYYYQANLNWNLYDNFTFISVFADAQLAYTKDKINLSRVIQPDFSQRITYINVPDDWTSRGLLDFSAPVRKLGVTAHIRVVGEWNRGISRVNAVDNTNTNLSQEYELSLENRKKGKWDVRFGARFTITDSRFSLQSSLNNRYRQTAFFGTLDYSPVERWNIEAKADLTTYSISGQSSTTFVPLLSCTATHFFLKNNRASVALTVFDLLNRNTGIQQTAQLNYFQISRVTILNRYVLLKFTYKLKAVSKK